jgi:hypothetical protein
MLEPRTPVMILVEASWQDQQGNRHAVPARMEDRSDGGACIRLKTEIEVGTRMGVEWRWEQFTGVAKYCRREGNEYVVGLQRDLPKPPARDVPWREKVRGGSVVVSTARVATAPKTLGSSLGEVPVARRRAEDLPAMRVAGDGAKVARPLGTERKEKEPDAIRRVEPTRAQPQNSRVAPSAEPNIQAPAKTEDAAEERKPMRRRWLEMAPWNQKQEAPIPRGSADNTRKNIQENPMPPVTATTERASQAAANPAPKNLEPKDEGAFQVELVPMEDIYRTAGIMIPRKGYSIKKVVEMLNSEHIRDLSTDMKRVAVLMALDAAGVPIEEILQDAKARQQALDTHEAEQKKRADAECAHKLEENTQIEAELERLKAHHTARINRNLEAVAREKAAFDDWLAVKQEESESMAEAAELCSKASEATIAPPPPAVKAAAKTG